MPVLTLTFPDGSDPTAVTMTALTRVDTGEAVSFTAAFTESSPGSGVWSNTWTAPTFGLSYLWSATATIGGVDVPFSGSKAADSSTTGDYWSVAGIRAIAGTTNADAYAVNGVSSYVTSGTRADNMINGAWADAGETTPIASDDDRFARLANLANDWALADMYFSRGMRDSNAGEANVDGVMSAKKKDAERLLSAMIFNWRKSGTYPTAGVSNAALRDTYGLGYRAIDGAVVVSTSFDGLD